MPNILLVDDHLSNLLALEQILAGVDAKLIKVTSGADALRCLLEAEIHCILLDVSMPEMDGFEFLETISKSPNLALIPIIMITGKVFSENEKLRAYQLGAVDFLVKPLDTDVVIRKVTVFVEQSQRAHLMKRTERFVDDMAESVLAPLRDIAAGTANTNGSGEQVKAILENLESFYEDWIEEIPK